MMILLKISKRQKGKERKNFGRKYMQRDNQKCEREYLTPKNERVIYSRKFRTVSGSFPNSGRFLQGQW